MRLTKTEVKNFRSFSEPVDLALSEGMNALVGPNNCGKSNFVRAIKMALDPEYQFEAGVDAPAQLKYAFPRVTLTFHCGGATSAEKTLLRYLREYERSVVSKVQSDYATDGIVRFVVTYRGNQQTGYARQEYFAARGAGDRRGDPTLNEKAIRQFRKVTRFVSVESGQSVEGLLKGKFREILHGVLQEDLRVGFSKSEKARQGYMEGLQSELLTPMRARVLEITKRLFPEVTDISLMPSVSTLNETLSNVEILIRDSVQTELSQKGTGVAGGVLIALLRYLTDASKQSLVLVLEEPEAFLHPSAQERLRDDLEGLTERTSVTLLVTTHSPYIISRSGRSQVAAIQKDPSGISRVQDSAAGNEAHSKSISGLFRDSVVPDLLDRYHQIPQEARALLLVEGTTDRDFLLIASQKLGYDDKLVGLHVIPKVGVDSLVAQAVLLRAEASQQVWALVDSDEPGRRGRDALTKRFGMLKSDVLEYGKFLNGLEDAESEWLFTPELMQRFVDEVGEDIVLKGKARRGGEFRYDWTPAGKDQFPAWLRRRSKKEDMARWVPVLELLVSKLTDLDQRT